MNKLVQSIISELKLQIFTEQDHNDKNIIAIFPGRFQPMGRHHKTAYDWLASQFGEENTFIVTSDKTEPDRSPFNFKEKRSVIIKHGVPKKQIVQVTNPYSPMEFFSKQGLDPKTTTIVYMVGEKDRGRLKSFKRLMKFNKTTYIPAKDLDEPYLYYVDAPHISYNIPSFGEMSGTTIRKALGDRDAKLAELKQRFESIMGWFDPKVFNLMMEKMNSNRGDLKEDIDEWFRFLSNMTQEQGQLFFSILKKEIGDTKDLLPIIQKFIKTKSLTPEEKKTFQTQMKDLLKLTGLGAFAIIPIPGTMLLIPVIVNLAKKFKINLLPEGFNNETKEELPIVRREFWNEVFNEVAKEEEQQQLDEVVIVPTEVVTELEKGATEMFKLIASNIQPKMTVRDLRGVMVGISSFSTRYTMGMDRAIKDSGLLNRKLTFLGFEFDGVANAPGDEMVSLIQYCIDTDSVVGPEIEAILDDTFTSEYERENKIDYEKFKKELDILKKPSSLASNAAHKSMYGTSRIVIDIPYIQLFLLFSLIKEKVVTGITIDSAISQYVKNQFVPLIVHEFTHYIQRSRELEKSKTMHKTAYADFMGGKWNQKLATKYLGDKMEIGAHASQFVVELKNMFPDKSNQELLKMLQTKTIPPKSSESYEKYLGDFYKNWVMDKGNKIKQRFIKIVYQILSHPGKNVQEILKKKNSLLTEGGVAGHMQHPFDDMNLTFGDLKEMFKLGLSGKITTVGQPTEKLDGMNLFVTFKDGKLFAARNTSDIKSGGMDYKTISQKFEGRGEVQEAFVYAFSDLQKAIQNLSEKQQNKIFGDGKIWMNLEVMYPKTANIINYDGAYIVFHGSAAYNDEGKLIKEIPENADILADMIEKVNAKTQKTFSIEKPKSITVGKSKNYNEKVKSFIQELDLLQKQMGCKDADTISVWHERWWKKFIESSLGKKGLRIEDDSLKGLAKRWAIGDKTFFLNSRNLPGSGLVEWAKETEKTRVKELKQKNMFKFESIVLKFGAEVLKNVKDVMALNPSEVTRKIKQDLQQAIDKLSTSKNVEDLQVLNTQLKRIEAAGGIDAIAPLEGIVFTYNGKTYKLTGTFAPVNRLIGYLKFK
jgi:hypothetical protein